MDRDRFAALYSEHADRLFGFLAYRVGDADVAEDLLSDVFERALRRRGLFDRRRGSEEAWLYAIALNLVRDRARRAGSERRALERLGGPDDLGPDPGDALAERDMVMRALAGLSSDEREVVALRFGGDLSTAQIAELLGVPVTTADGRLYRALRRLREGLERSGIARE